MGRREGERGGRGHLTFMAYIGLPSVMEFSNVTSAGSELGAKIVALEDERANGRRNSGRMQRERETESKANPYKLSVIPSHILYITVLQCLIPRMSITQSCLVSFPV